MQETLSILSKCHRDPPVPTFGRTLRSGEPQSVRSAITDAYLWAV